MKRGLNRTLFQLNVQNLTIDIIREILHQEKNMYDLINSDENKVTNVFSTLFER